MSTEQTQPSTDETIKIKIKMTANSNVYEISIKKSQTILDLKKECEPKVNLPPEGQNLVYRGKILANDQTIASYNIQNDHTIILVKKANFGAPQQSAPQQSQPQSQPQPQTNQSQQQQPNPFAGFGGMGGMPNMMGGMPNMMGGMGGMGGMSPQMMQQMLSNPMYLQMMNQMLQDPNTLNMILNSPQIKPLLDANPQLREIMSNPQMMQSILNPQAMQSALAMMGGMGGMPGVGTNPMGGMPNLGAMPNMANLFGGMGGMPQTGAQQPSSQPQSQPQEQPQQNVDYKVLYKDQLNQLKDMGFVNEETNIEVLKKCDGNVQFAIERLLNMFQ